MGQLDGRAAKEHTLSVDSLFRLMAPGCICAKTLNRPKKPEWHFGRLARKSSK